MFQILRKNKDKAKYFATFTFVLIFLLLVTVVFKNDSGVKSGEKIAFFQHPDLKSIKEFLLTKLKSPFINIDYEIKSGDSIQKILKKFQVQNNEIQTVINQYKL